ncbi:MAG: alanine racemase [Gammaproteobacteria bacterium HGW-Gammaproteobacteria-14]|nr:MAG: alanine racemase [Gammaproteobacteria bacterium HGW-Gammaproteobacteria-14]
MRGTRLELRSHALKQNARRAAQLAGAASVFAMVKANGYGHGLGFVASSLVGEVSGFGVALLDEALQLRAEGILQPVMLLEGCFDAEELREAAASHCELVLHSEWQIRLLESTVLPAPVNVWLKLDTGMHRLGLPLSHLAHYVQRIRACQQVFISGVAGHFACADNQSDELSVLQLQRLTTAAMEYGVPFSAANSAALFRYPDSLGARVRPGIMLYGSSPFADRNAQGLGLAVTQRLSARIIAINDVPSGDSVGYGCTWTASKDSRIAVVSIGYGDGYPRHAPSGTPVAVANADSVWRRSLLVGRVSMDMITIDVTELPQTAVGDEVELWGDHVSVDEVARHCGTISYELFCRMTSRPERCYL